MKKFLLILLSLCLVIVTSVQAQAETELKLSLSRDFGYGGMGNDIQGMFSMKIKDPPENLLIVDFMIDEQVIYTDDEPPFHVQFNTDSYTLGTHTLLAVGTMSNGQTLHSQEIVVDFVAADEAWKSVGGIIGPVFGLLALVMLVTFVIPLVFSRRKNKSMPLGAPRNYGVTGGTICPKCKRPFVMHFFAPNIIVGKLDMCPHCGKWSIVRRYPQDILDAAVAAELDLAKAQQTSTPESTEEKLRKELEDSKYQDG